MRLFLACLLLNLPGFLCAGTLEGKVVISGKIPKLKTSHAFNPYGNAYGDDYGSPSSEGSETKAMTEMPHHLLVYLEGVPGHYKPPAKMPTLGQKNKQFTEDIIPVMSGGELEITNEDTVYHHIRSSTKPWTFNLNKKGPGESESVAFEPKKDEKTGVVPVYCDIHSHMRAHVVVVDNPFYQLLDETGGKFSIKNVPPGTYTLNAFHPTLKFEPFKVTIGKGKNAKPVIVTMVGEK
jgi:plastocyanin